MTPTTSGIWQPRLDPGVATRARETRDSAIPSAGQGRAADVAFSLFTGSLSAVLLAGSRCDEAYLRAVVWLWLAGGAAWLLGKASRSASELARGDVLLVFSIGYQTVFAILDPVRAASVLENVGAEALASALGYVCMFVAVAVLTVSMFRFLAPRSPGRRPFACHLRWRTVAVVAASAILAAWLLRLAACGFDFRELARISLRPRLPGPWGHDRTWTNVVVHRLLRHVSLLAPVALVVAAMESRRATTWAAVLPFWVLGLMLVLHRGSRFYMLCQFLVVAGYWAVMQRPKIARLTVVCAVLVVFGAVVAQFTLISRSRGGVQSAMENVRFASSATYRAVSEDSLSAFAGLVARQPAGQATIGWHVYAAYLVCHPIPRAFWPAKPTIRPEMYAGTKKHYVTWFAIGDFYAMGGWLFLVGGAVLCGWLALLVERVLPSGGQPTPSEVISFWSAAMWLYLVSRGLLGAVLYSYSLLWIPAVVAVLSRSQRLRRGVSPSACQLSREVRSHASGR